MNALDFLKRDHRKVEDLLARLQGPDVALKRQLFEQLRAELEMHTRLEQEAFYPAYRRVYTPDSISPDEAEAQHREVSRLLDRLSGLDPASEDFDRTLSELRKDVEHHVREEETEMFVKAQDKMSAAELEDLGRKLDELKSSLAAGARFRKTA